MVGKLCVKCDTNEQTAHHHYCRPCKKTSDHTSYLRHKEARLVKAREYVMANKELVAVRRRAYTEVHKDEAVARASRWNEAYKDRHIVHARNSAWKKYGIINPDGTPFTSIDYDRAYQIQQGKCKGCDVHQSDLKNRLHTDHDHTTGFFRFLLCMNCNRALGHAQDSPNILRTLAALLEEKNGQF